MKIPDTLRRPRRLFKAFGLERTPLHAGDDPPLRSELFNADQLEAHGRNLAAAHKLTPLRGRDQLLPRLAENELVLLNACNLLTAAVRANRRITPAGEWLLDNFYLIDEQIRTAKRHLPKGYSRELPRLAHGSSAGLPRVYAIALDTIAHGDARVDPQSLTRFVVAYQSVSPVTLGELWAIPIMLRLALIENLRRVAADVAAGRVDRDLANGWADQMTAIAKTDPKSLILVIADMARSNPPMTTAFVSELARRLQGHGPALALPLTWIEQRLSESHLTIEQLVQAGSQQQAANQVSISNSIGSLRFLAAMDWRSFVETMSVVERELAEDPDGSYRRMDFATRDQYRHAVEKIARASERPELEVARQAIALARKSLDAGAADARRSHVGFYLVDAGRPALELAMGLRKSDVAPARLSSTGRALAYVGGVLVLTGLLSAVPVAKAHAAGLQPVLVGVLCVLALVATSQLAVALVNWLLTLLVTPHSLPRMDFSRGIPADGQTLVAVPALLTSAQAVEDLVEALEVRFLANRDANLHFALVTDFLDAAEATTPGDAMLVQLARERVEALNAKYRPAPTQSPPVPGAFHLLHRPRVWNARERTWMGYERKRGKLGALNALLRGAGGAAAGFSLIVGDVEALVGMKYVITLDTDTELPRDAARVLVGAMAHPLNRARYDPARERVVHGYGILQPRIVTSLPGANRSRYAQVFGGETGIDPYTRAVSDVYQDAFGEGSFIGKGIYDVDAFELALDGRFPENRILSHDLLEGSYARSGLISDVQLYDEYPSRYSGDVSRRRRWIRGDWQVAGWLLRRVPGTDGRRRRNPLSLLSQWKVLDNLRRSLVPPALLALFLLAWLRLEPAWGWTLLPLAIVLAPVVIATLLELARKPAEMALVHHVLYTSRTAARRAVQIAVWLACLPHEAFYTGEAILRTHWRMIVTRRHLLEWMPSSEVQRRDRDSLGAAFASMWIGPVVAVAVAVGIASRHPASLGVAMPFLALWLVSPALAWWMSRPRVPHSAKLAPRDALFLRLLARRTWGYFEAFVAPADHWLPPDNYQEVPVGTIAHRTSPTNMGMALLADLAAYDFGWIPAGRLVERLVSSLQTMQSLRRHGGHFYNWYDTQTLQPLSPRYVSSVDSGNLAGHLLTLRAGLSALPRDCVVEARLLGGLVDTAQVLEETLQPYPPAEVVWLCTELAAVRDSRPATAVAMKKALKRALVAIDSVRVSLDGRRSEEGAPVPDESQRWLDALATQCRGAQDELVLFLPWLDTPRLDELLAELPMLARVPTLQALADGMSDLMPRLDGVRDAAATAAKRERMDNLSRLVDAAAARARARVAAIGRLGTQCAAMASMDFRSLYDPARHLFAIGYNVEERQRDASYYDLLASEARLTCFVAIAQGQVPQESWFALGRLLTSAADRPLLMSWSGSMFEYLMPMLVMPTYENTLLDETCKAAVARQVLHGRRLGVPWGMSESGYNAVDASLNFQYRAFGVPGLGLKRGLANDVVIAPYASVLALMVAPEAACANLQRLSADGMAGTFGLFEAVDYTPSRLPHGQSSAIVRSFMAHHQGMSLLALGHLLLDRPMQRRFESDPLFQATLLLLQERIPKTLPQFPHLVQLAESRINTSEPEAPVRVIPTADTAMPEVQLLSNGRYHVMVTQAGGGGSRWKDLALTRWREDATCDHWGTFCYIRDVPTGEFWSTSHQPTCRPADQYEAIFSEGRAEFRRRDHGLDAHTEIAVSPEDDIELRRVRIVNRTRVRKVVDLTSYAEIVLAPPAQDVAHPAFSNLFVQTEIVAEEQAILCTRRPRSPGEATPWAFHLMTVHGATGLDVSYETDRMRFLGRGNTPAAPRAMRDPAPLSGTHGPVLDPIAAIRVVVALEAGQSATVDMVYGIAETRQAAIGLVGKYQDPRLADRVVELAWTHAQVVLRQINASEPDARLFARLANSIVFANGSLRGEASVIARNRRGQSALWAYAISGDLPIVLVRIADVANIELVRQLVHAHAYWRLKGLAVDLVIWNEDHAGYRQLLQDQIIGLIAARVEAQTIDRPGGIFVRRGDQISDEDRVLVLSAARVIIADDKGTLAEQAGGRALAETRVPRLVPSRDQRIDSAATKLPRRALLLANGLGGFTPDGTEYVITTHRGRLTPAPWVNVLANPHFGTVVSESGGAYTWAENAHEFRLTPWSNDAVSDGSGEACYLRDEESGHFWSPSPLPARGRTPYVTRHGFGYTVFEHDEDGIGTELWLHVATDAAVKFSTLRIRNTSGSPRRISVTGYVEWVLGDLRAKSLMHIVTDVDGKIGTVFARNRYSTEFGERVAFFDVDDATRTLTCDRVEFIGRNGSLAAPAAMGRTRLSGRSGPALDPCAAVQVMLELGIDEEREVTFRLGVGRDVDDARRLVHRFRGAVAARTALEDTRTWWRHTLDAVRIETPDATLDVLANGWLVYQTLACRLWARSGFYQSGGAFGFRDQLQDTLALVHAEPQLTRAQILLCASRQFVEGDVQHWWHPPSGRGVRTQCSDDFLWLPLAIARYVQTTGDTEVLDEPIAFLEGRPVNPGEDSYYDLPGRSVEAATLYEHGVRAIRHGLRYGSHGLPLMGCGDWNDGMNLVGIEGRGESVWLGFFLCSVLAEYAKVAGLKGDDGFARLCDEEIRSLRVNIEAQAWDGGWYRRAYFDDGSPLGSAANLECRIDSISQSWSVLSGVADPARSRAAMAAVYAQLVRRDDALVALLSPPFDQSPQHPGYIRGYVPGVRENGGQYTHGAIWAVMAYAALGDAARAWELMNMINPVRHGRTEAEVARYRVEPYVVTADVYAMPPHTGRGGWSWYTGSAGWMYRLIVESLLGLRREGTRLRFEPCLPPEWKGFTLRYRYGETMYRIEVRQDSAAIRPILVRLDGTMQEDDFVPLVDDAIAHVVEITLRTAPVLEQTVEGAVT